MRCTHVGVLGLALGLAACAGGGDDLGQLRQHVEPTGPILNEIEVNPPGTDNPYEYVELRGPAGSTIPAGTYFITIDGDPGGGAATGAGVIDNVIDVSGLTFGSNGLIMLRSSSGHAAAEAGTTVVDNARFDNVGGGLENGSITFALVSAAAAPVIDTDLDTNDDGTLEGGSPTIIDSIAINDGGADDKTYGVAVLPPLAMTIQAMTRFSGDVSVQLADAWYYGAMNMGASDGVDYNPAALSANFPAGGILTPGGKNLPATADEPDASPLTPDADPAAPDADLTQPDADLTQPDADLTQPDAGEDEDIDAGLPRSGGGGGCGCSVGDAPSSASTTWAFLAFLLFGFAVLRNRPR